MVQIADSRYSWWYIRMTGDRTPTGVAPTGFDPDAGPDYMWVVETTRYFVEQGSLIRDSIGQQIRRGNVSLLTRQRLTIMTC